MVKLGSRGFVNSKKLRMAWRFSRNGHMFHERSKWGAFSLL